MKNSRHILSEAQLNPVDGASWWNQFIGHLCRVIHQNRRSISNSTLLVTRHVHRISCTEHFRTEECMYSKLHAIMQQKQFGS